MKKIISSLLVLVMLAPVANGQKTESRGQAIGLSFFLNDFITPDRIRNTSLNQVISDKRFARMNQMNAGLAVNYFKGVGAHVDFAGSIGGSFLNYPMPNKTFGTDAFLIEGTAQVNLKMTTEQYWVQPYISAGVGAHKYRNYYGAFLPLGLGLKVNFFDEAHLYITTSYRVPVTTETASYHLQHGIGIAGSIGGKKKEEAAIPMPPPPPDTDGDGIIDPSDNCPTVRGMARYQGCPIPDSDKDGINDEDDKCKDVPGLARYSGCPVPDKDKDGITDEDDKCPDAFGVARYNGCPVSDKDKDGVNDEDDKCVELAGTEDNLGCPVISGDLKTRTELAAKNILFVGTTAKLNAKSNKGLDDVAKIMVEKKELYLDIESETDEKAAAVKTYLTRKGIPENRIRANASGANTVNLALNYY